MSLPGQGHDGTNRTKNLFSVSGRKDVQSKGSDIEYDFVCDPCEEEGHRFKAYGFCSDCNHYLCETCYTVHRRPIPMRNHKLLDKNDMPKVRPKPTSSNTEVIEEQCDIHVGKLVEFYCGNHDTTGCSACMTLEHKSCNSVQFVPGMAIDKDEVEEIMKQLSAFNSNAKATQDRAKQRVSLTKDSFDNAKQEAKNFIKKTKDFIERLENDFEKSMQKECKNEVEKVEFVIEGLEATVQETESLSEQLTGYMSLKKKANLFIAMKKAEKFIEYSSLKDFSEESNAHFVFTPDKELESLPERVECLGSVEPVSRQKRAKPSAIRKVKLRAYNQFSVHAKDDTSDCIIVGISQIYEPSRTVIADAGNNKIKVAKDETKTVTASLKLSSKPHAMTELDNSKVCVLFQRKRKSC